MVLGRKLASANLNHKNLLWGFENKQYCCTSLRKPFLSAFCYYLLVQKLINVGKENADTFVLLFKMGQWELKYIRELIVILSALVPLKLPAIFCSLFSMRSCVSYSEEYYFPRGDTEGPAALRVDLEFKM